MPNALISSDSHGSECWSEAACRSDLATLNKAVFHGVSAAPRVEGVLRRNLSIE